MPVIPPPAVAAMNLTRDMLLAVGLAAAAGIGVAIASGLVVLALAVVAP